MHQLNINEESADRWANFFKVLSDETRLRILMLLSQKELCVCEMCQILNLSQPKISRHLAKMRDLNLIRYQKEGQWTFYYLSIGDPLFSGIIQQLVVNSQSHPVICKDMEKLIEKERSGKLCERIK